MIQLTKLTATLLKDAEEQEPSSRPTLDQIADEQANENDCFD